MENGVDLPLIRYEFKHGSEETQAFVNICKNHELDPPMNSTVSNWFERFRNFDHSLKRQIGKFYYNLLRAIIFQYAKFNYAIFCHDKDVWNYASDEIIRNRFKLVSNGDASSFIAFDSFTGGLKMIQTTIGEQERTRFFFPALITHERILLNVDRRNDEYILLLNADFDQLNFSVIGETPLYMICQQIVLDSTNNLRFLFRVGDLGNDTSMQKRHIVGDRIHLNHEEILFEAELLCCKLIGDQLFALHYEQGDEDGWHYVEYDLSSNSARKVNQRLCSGSQTFADIFHEDRKYPEYVWSSNKLYAVRDFEKYFAIAVFDSDTLTWSRTNLIGAGYVDKLTIDEDDMLTISTTENRRGFYKVKPKTVYRVPMRKPDKLRYIAWFKIRREAIFSGSKLDFLLPYTSEFREFSDNY